jgi:hypothetical protein
MKRWNWIVIGLLLSPGLWGCSSEKPTPPMDPEIQALIDQLVSPNPKPITGKEDENVEPDYRLPAGFDRDKQKQVHSARRELRQLGPKAFPFLIERWGDEKYCLTCSEGINGYCFNQTVGAICESIIFDQLQPYSFWPRVDGDPRGKPKRPDYPGRFLGSREAARQWWEKNKDKSLYQMQLEILDWVIAEEAKRPADFTDKEKQGVHEIRQKLVKSGKPLPPGNYDWTDIEQ